MANAPDKQDCRAPRLILASTSPRRAALLRESGYAFEVIPPRLHEPDELAGHPTPAAEAEALAYYKARSIADLVNDGIILGADTVVSLGDRQFGKPVDRADARRILETLTGTTHDVITGVALLNAATQERLIQHDSTAVTMRRMTDPELEEYLESRAWEGKAGAYGIQDRADAFVTRTRGSFTNVVGLPMELVRGMLDQWRFPQPESSAQSA